MGKFTKFIGNKERRQEMPEGDFQNKVLSLADKSSSRELHSLETLNTVRGIKNKHHRGIVVDAILKGIVNKHHAGEVEAGHGVSIGGVIDFN